MPKLKAICCAALAALTVATFAPRSAAQPPPQCKWGIVAVTSGEIPSHGVLWSRVQAACDGGAGGCVGRVVLRQYVWDAFNMAWAERPGTSQTQVVQAHCGEIVTRGYTGYRSDWPINTICCLSTQWQVYNGKGYVNSGQPNYLYFNNW